MTRYFEVLRRDGPARVGRLLLEEAISTPAIISPEDYVSAGSVFNYHSLEEAEAACPSLEGPKRLVIPPFVTSAIHYKPSLEIPFFKGQEGPIGQVLHPFFSDQPEKADVYVINSAGSLKNPRDLVGAVIGLREKIPSDSALYAPALATPSNLGLLIYLGIDLIDATRTISDAYFGRYHTRDGIWPLDALQELPCRCDFCQDLARKKDVHHLAHHNILKLEEELIAIREMIRKEILREYIERQVRVSPEQTTALRLLDNAHNYLEARTPQRRKSILYANTAESLNRVEVTRFAHRVLNRYAAPRSEVLLLLPCSSKKPYSASKSHRLFRHAIGRNVRHLHEVILTSPLALVPRELEEVYPASQYDVPVTGHWDLEERAWLLSCLEIYLEKNRYSKIVAHLEGDLKDTLEGHGIDAIYTDGGVNDSALLRLKEAVDEACKDAPRLGDMRLGRYRALLDYYFGAGAADTLLEGKIRAKGREVQDESGRALAMLTHNGDIALSIEGAKRLATLGKYIVTIGDFLPRGSLLAPGVLDADEQIRPGDEVIVRGEKAFGVGRARMSGWEMVESSRGVAVELKQIRET